MLFVRKLSLATINIAMINIAAILLIPSTSSLAAGDLEMVDAFGNITGVIDVSNRGLSVFENSGARLFYQRAPRYDLPGGRYLGFYNLELNRIIRFPRSGRGPVERADLDTPTPRFVPATVSVRPIGSGPGFAPYIGHWLNQPTAPLRPGIGSTPFGSGMYGAVPGGRYGGGYQPYGTGGSYGIGGSYGVGTGYAVSGIELNVGPITLTPQRDLRPALSGLRSNGLSRSQPRSVLLDSNRINKANLPPVKIEFFNSSDDSIVVTMTDAVNPGKKPQYRLAPAQRQAVLLPRDAGQTRVDVYQTTDVTGIPIEQEVRVDVPPAPRYEIVVHRVRIQSIAIDRTGKSPNPVEDINVQGVGVGRFRLPPGDQLTPGVIDVYQVAQAAGNQGIVAPISFND